MSHKILWIGLLLVALLIPPLPAGAATYQVTATSSDVFTPADVTIAPGDTVTWTNGGGNHNVRFDDGSFEMPATPDTSPWTVSRTFGTVGTFRYYCYAHGLPNGVGMSGAVYVNAAGGGGGGPGSTPPPAQSGQPVSADKTAPALKLSGSTRQRVLRQRSVFVLVRLDEPARVVARARISVVGAGSVRAKTVTKQVAARKTTRFGLTFSRPKLKSFRRALRKRTSLSARISVTAKDPAGNTSSATRRVKLRP